MLWINYKVELKLKLAKYYILAVAGVDNIDDTPDNIIVTIKDIKLHVPEVTLLAKENQKLSKLLSKDLYEKSIQWNGYKAKCENKNSTNENRYFLKPNIVGANGFFVLIYSIKDDNAKRFKARKYYLPKGVIWNYNVIINGKNFCVQQVGSDVKRYEKIKILTTGQGDD